MPKILPRTTTHVEMTNNQMAHRRDGAAIFFPIVSNCETMSATAPPKAAKSQTENVSMWAEALPNAGMIAATANDFFQLMLFVHCVLPFVYAVGFSLALNTPFVVPFQRRFLAGLLNGAAINQTNF